MASGPSSLGMGTGGDREGTGGLRQPFRRAGQTGYGWAGHIRRLCLGGTVAACFPAERASSASCSSHQRSVFPTASSCSQRSPKPLTSSPSPVQLWSSAFIAPPSVLRFPFLFRTPRSAAWLPSKNPDRQQGSWSPVPAPSPAPQTPLNTVHQHTAHPEATGRGSRGRVSPGAVKRRKRSFRGGAPAAPAGAGVGGAQAQAERVAGPAAWDVVDHRPRLECWGQESGLAAGRALVSLQNETTRP